jgi:hypothetical protein
MIKEQISESIQKVIDGNANPLEVYVFLTDLEKYIKKCKDEIQDYAVSEAFKFSEKTFVFNGVRVEKVECKRVWSFKNIPQWKELSEKQKLIEEATKQAYLSKEKGQTICDENGEIIPPAECNFSKSYIKIIL